MLPKRPVHHCLRSALTLRFFRFDVPVWDHRTANPLYVEARESYIIIITIIIIRVRVDRVEKISSETLLFELSNVRYFMCVVGADYSAVARSPRPFGIYLLLFFFFLTVTKRIITRHSWFEHNR